MPDRLSQGDLATLSLLDREQGVCPKGHKCRVDREPGFRMCETCEYRGIALICWQITNDDIVRAAEEDANPVVIEWARLFVADRVSP